MQIGKYEKYKFIKGFRKFPNGDIKKVDTIY